MAIPKKTKLKALKESGTLNASPEDVKDELFRTVDFFDAHDLLQVKYEMLRKVIKEGWNIVRAAKEFGFSRPHFYELRTSFNEEGLFGLLPQKRGPKKPYKLNDKVMNFVETSLNDNPSIHVTTLCRLIEEKFSVSVHRTTLERAIERRKKKWG